MTLKKQIFCITKFGYKSLNENNGNENVWTVASSPPPPPPSVRASCLETRSSLLIIWHDEVIHYYYYYYYYSALADPPSLSSSLLRVRERLVVCWICCGLYEWWKLRFDYWQCSSYLVQCQNRLWNSLNVFGCKLAKMWKWSLIAI